MSEANPLEDPEFLRAVSEYDLSTPTKLRQFKAWQRTDGTKNGLERISAVNPGSLQAEIDRAKAILNDALIMYQPVAVFAGFSGGYDSLVATHFTMSNESSARPLHLNTGIGIEKTREFVRRVSGEQGWNLWEEKTPESYEDLVLGRCYTKAGDKLVYPGGFPGPPMHGFMYQRLKERPLANVIRQVKAGKHRNSTVMIVTGIRHDESKIRAGYKRAVSKANSQVWVNPFYWATIDHFREYRKTYFLPTNPVKDRTGLSGECLCSAHASKGELIRIRAACSDTADYLEDLQVRVADAGFPWGYEDRAPEWWLNEQRDKKRGQRTLWDAFGETSACKPGPMCHSCEKFSAGLPQEIGGAA